MNYLCHVADRVYRSKRGTWGRVSRRLWSRVWDRLDDSVGRVGDRVFDRISHR